MATTCYTVSLSLTPHIRLWLCQDGEEYGCWYPADINGDPPGLRWCFDSKAEARDYMRDNYDGVAYEVEAITI